MFTSILAVGDVTAILIGVVALVVGAIGALVVARTIAGSTIGNAKSQAARIRAEAETEASAAAAAFGENRHRCKASPTGRADLHLPYRRLCRHPLLYAVKVGESLNPCP